MISSTNSPILYATRRCWDLCHCQPWNCVDQRQAIGYACGLGQPGPAALTQYLREKQLLLDNCEHLLAAAPAITLAAAAMRYARAD
ncbi:MAG: hypothetical protein ABIV47_07890 [Roseiflexaceae bacterium]